MLRSTALAALLCALTLPVSANNWTQWRGPNRDGITPHSGSLIGSQKSLRKLWDLDVGIGYAAPSISKGRVFILGFRDGKDTVRCLNGQSGQAVWSYSYPAKNFKMQNAGGTAASPAIAQGRVLTLSRDGQLHCFGEDSGKVLWKAQLSQRFGIKPPPFGFSGSPVVVGDRIYLDVGCVAALNLKDGKTIWKSRNYGPQYSSPAFFTYKGQRYIATYPTPGLVIVEESSGKEVASYTFRHRWPNIHAATPLITKDGSRIFISSGYRLGGAWLRFDGQSLKEQWKGQEMRNEMATSILVDDMIVGFDNAVLKAVDRKTGKRLWSQRGLGKGSLIMVGRELVILSSKGELVIAPISRDGFKPGLRQTALRGRGCWSAPVYASGLLLLRDPRGQMVCLAAGNTGTAPKPAPKKKRWF